MLRQDLNRRVISGETGERDCELPENDIISYWAGRWQNGDTPWNLGVCHPSLSGFFGLLTITKKKLRIFIPFCGKSKDIKWLLDRGHTVVGVEAVTQAVEELFQEQEWEYTKTDIPEINGNIFQCSGVPLEVWNCNLYLLTDNQLGQFDAIWDTGGIGSTFKTERHKYLSVMKSICLPTTKYLVSTFDYEGKVFKSQPPPMNNTVLQQCAGYYFEIEWIHSEDLTNQKQRSQIAAGEPWLIEHTFLLTPKPTCFH